MSLSTYARRALSHLHTRIPTSRIAIRAPITQCTCAAISHATPSYRTFFSASSNNNNGTSASNDNNTSTSSSTSTSSTTNTEQAQATSTTPSVESLQKSLAEKEKTIAEKDKLLAEAEKKLKDLTDKFQRQLAETENIRQRGFAETAKAKQYAITSFAKSLLEIADTLILASKAAEPAVSKNDNPDLNALYEGVKMTEKILHKVFEQHGVKKFESLGEKFDPHRHDGIFQMDDATKEPGTIAHVMKDGWLIDDRVLRAATVGTVKPRPKPATPTPTPASETPAK